MKDRSIDPAFYIYIYIIIIIIYYYYYYYYYMYIIYIKFGLITLKYTIACHDCQAFFFHTVEAAITVEATITIGTIEIMRAVYRHAQV
jgi:hypothetical protein